MAIPKHKNKLTVAKHRAKLSEKGYRAITLWIFDIRKEDFLNKVKRECLDLRNSTEEKEILEFNLASIEAVEGWEA